MVGSVGDEILLDDSVQGSNLALVGAGAWIAINARGLEASIQTLIAKYPSVKKVAIDTPL